MGNEWIYQAAKGFDAHLERELTLLGPWKKLTTGLYSGPVAPENHYPIWVQNIWTAPEILEFTSVKEAAQILRERQGLWYPYLTIHHRRGALIQELLPRFRNKPKPFPYRIPTSNIGAWTLLDEKTLLASPKTTSPFPGGEALFEENKTDPPSSAYLKLWEALSLGGYWKERELRDNREITNGGHTSHLTNGGHTSISSLPGPQDRCLDAGACPGGWTWVLANLGAYILAVDRSPLEKGVDLRPEVEFRSGDGFKITPDRVKREGWEPFTWILSDMAAYPGKVWDWVELWRISDPHLKFIITLKMQGEADWETMEKFQALPGSHLVHLYNNKHEVTWIKT